MEDNNTIFREIDILLAQGRYQDAIPLLLNILYEEPDNKDALHRIGVAYTESGDQDAALKTLKYILTMEQNDADIWEAYGCACYRKSNLKEAKIAFEKAIEIFPQHASALRNLGVTLNMLRKFKESYEILHKSLEINDNDYLTLFALSNVCINLDYLEEARKTLNRLLNMDIPEDIRKQAEITLQNVDIHRKHF
ncbi:tetratricopeptide repeat protein [Spirochaetia bacterium 38H-sp]|uniref:Tetratricopeptide repeat protein n=1 Tax=Rarispira pelagica TaxID=3141764 RepID=A0ABU9UAV4_9SPIR